MRQGRSSKAWPSVAAIAEDLGVNRKTAMRAAGDLEQLGLVVVERRYGAVNRYRIAPDGHENPSPKGTGCQTRPVPQRDRTSPPKGPDQSPKGTRPLEGPVPQRDRTSPPKGPDQSPKGTRNPYKNPYKNPEDKHGDSATAEPPPALTPPPLDVPTDASAPGPDRPPKPPVAELSAALMARYPDPSLLAAARDGCELTRRSGRMADSVWLRTLERLAKLPVAAVEEAIAAYLDGHADGDKGEAYLLAIARRKARPQRLPTAAMARSGPGPRPASPPSAFTGYSTLGELSDADVPFGDEDLEAARAGGCR